MTTLTVTTTNDFSGDPLVGISDIVFDNASTSVLVTFSAAQFNIIQISNSVNITGDADQNVLIVKLNTAHTFDASGWTISNWINPDFVEIEGTNGADTITGPSASGGFVLIRGGGGADIVHGGNAINIFDFNAGDIKAGDQIFGGAVQDSIRPSMDGSTYDFRLVDMSSVSVLDLGRGAGGTSSTVILDGDQIGAAGAITTIFGANNFWTSNVAVQGQTVDLSAVSFFSWTDGVDAVRVAGTKGADSLMGSIKIDTLFGSRGHDLFTGGLGDDIFDFNSKFNSLKGAKRDVISDFSVGDNVGGGLEDDLIDLKTIDANFLRAGNQHFKFVSKFHHKAGELDVKQDLVHGTTIVQGDIDGNGKADFQIELNGLLSLSKLDFIL